MNFTAIQKVKIRHVFVVFILLVSGFLFLNMTMALYYNFFVERRAERIVSYGPYNGADPKHMIVMLQGAHMTLQDFMQLAYILAPELQDTIFIAPEAVMKSARPGRRKWYTTVLNTDTKTYASGVQESGAIITALIANLHDKYNMPYDKIGVVGFSQGGTIAIQTAINSPVPLWAVVSYAGVLYPSKPSKSVMGIPVTIIDIENPQNFDVQRIETPLLLYYGQEDDIVDYSRGLYAKEVLKRNGAEASVNIVLGATHTDIHVALDHAIAFLRERE